MIDDIRKAFVCLGCEAVYSDSPVSSCDCLNGGGFDEHYIVDAEIIRNARRYLELKKQFAPLSMDIDGNHSWCWRGNPSRMKGPTFDAAADRLLEGGK